MDVRGRPFRFGILLCIGMLLMGSIAFVAPAAAVSADDCDTLLNGRLSRPSNGGSASDLATLAATATDFSNTAADISDKKLKQAMSTIAAIYKAASKGKNVAGASLIMAKKAKAYSKAYGVYSKALTDCELQSITSTTSD